MDYVELYEAFWMYVDAVEALEKKSIAGGARATLHRGDKGKKKEIAVTT